MSASPIHVKYNDVFVELQLLDRHGQPFMLPSDKAEEDIYNLPFVDAIQCGSIMRPAEIVLRFKHPKEVTPDALLHRQQMIINIIKREQQANLALMQQDLGGAVASAESDGFHQQMTGE